MTTLALSKTGQFKLLSKLIDYALFSNMSLIHIEKQEATATVTVKYGAFDHFAPALKLSAEQGASLWQSIMQHTALNSHCLHDNITVHVNHQTVVCQLDYLITPDKQIIIIKLETAFTTNKTWHDFGFANALGDDLLDTIIDLRGLVLIAGSNNTQKTALAYALLNEISHNGLVVHSLESPILHHQSKFMQSQWRPGQGYSYQDAVEAIYRQDADVIYLDSDRLLDWQRLTTITNTKLTIVRSESEDLTQLLDLLLQHDLNHHLLTYIKLIFLIKDARQNCPHCSHSTDITNQETITLSRITGLDIADINHMRFQIADGCLHCDWRGYQNTITLFDLLIPDTNLINALKLLTPDQIHHDSLHDAFYINSLEDAWLKANQGLISHREIIRLFA